MGYGYRAGQETLTAGERKKLESLGWRAGRQHFIGEDDRPDSLPTYEKFDESGVRLCGLFMWHDDDDDKGDVRVAEESGYTPGFETLSSDLVTMGLRTAPAADASGAAECPECHAADLEPHGIFGLECPSCGYRQSPGRKEES